MGLIALMSILTFNRWCNSNLTIRWFTSPSLDRAQYFGNTLGYMENHLREFKISYVASRDVLEGLEQLPMFPSIFGTWGYWKMPPVGIGDGPIYQLHQLMYLEQEDPVAKCNSCIKVIVGW